MHELGRVGHSIDISGGPGCPCGGGVVVSVDVVVGSVDVVVGSVDVVVGSVYVVMGVDRVGDGGV